MKIRVFEAFAGYGSQSLALERLKKDFPSFDYEIVGISEIDKHAVQAYNALHPGVKNYGDISRINWDDVPDFDLFTYSSPCQDFSVAGKGAGGTEGSGTRSSLLWECRRAIVSKRPKFLLLENVAALVSNKFRPLFNKWQAELLSYGYSNFAKVLNSKDYGVPQNRYRIFLVSILGDVSYHFPKPFPLEKRLKDVLEDEVPEKYYLSDKMLEYFRRVNEDLSHGHKFKPKSEDDVATVIKANPAANADDNYIEYEDPTICQRPHGFNRGGVHHVAPTITGNTFQYNNLVVQRKTVVGDVNGESPCITSACGAGGGTTPMVTDASLEEVRTEDFREQIRGHSATNNRIRKLTPRELFRLMGVDDQDIDKIQATGISDSAQKKLAGNSIVVDVLYHIFRKMFVEKDNENRQLTLF